jgi:hypothetical protein
LTGNAANNTLAGAAGNDILQGGAGNDTLNDTAGKNLFDGGAGTDSLTGGNGIELFIGGKGTDTITTSTGADIILLNRGDGQDTISASTGKNNVLSLGGGITYADLAFKKSGNDLVMMLGSSDQATFKDWYTSTNNHSVATLQAFIGATGDYNAAGDALHNRKIETFNFDGLAGAFDTARAANASLTSWSLATSLQKYYLSGSDTSAYGGALAGQYATAGTLAGIALGDAETVIGASGFGTGLQDTGIAINVVGQPLLV